MQAYATACKLMELHASLWNCMKACNLMELNQCWNELFELFNYSNSWDRIVVFGIHIRSFSGFRILFELFEYLGPVLERIIRTIRLFE